MAKKKTSAMIAQPGTPADGYTLNVEYDPENGDAFEAKAIFNDGTVKNFGSGDTTVVDAIIDGSVKTVVSNAKTVRRYAFYFVDGIEKFILNEVETLDSYSLYGTNAKIYMPKIKKITSAAIGAYGRTKFYLPSTISYITSGTFTSGAQITDIYCDFAQGAVAGAPWGATGATVHYNVPYPASIDEME